MSGVLAERLERSVLERFECERWVAVDLQIVGSELVVLELAGFGIVDLQYWDELDFVVVDRRTVEVGFGTDRFGIVVVHHFVQSRLVACCSSEAFERRFVVAAVGLDIVVGRLAEHIEGAEQTVVAARSELDYLRKQDCCGRREELDS